jgi:hypothetical protein
MLWVLPMRVQRRTASPERNRRVSVDGSLRDRYLRYSTSANGLIFEMSADTRWAWMTSKTLRFAGLFPSEASPNEVSALADGRRQPLTETRSAMSPAALRALCYSRH